MSEPSVITVRASSWGSLFDCAHRWEADHLLKIRKPSGLRTQLGTAIHASTAAFDAARLAEQEITPDAAADVFIDKLHHPEYDVDYSQDDLTVKEAEKIGLTLHTKYCTEISPKMNYLSVEMPLQPMEIDCGGGVAIRLTGTMDRARVVKADDGKVINDLKTGRRLIASAKGEVSIKGRAAQLGTYQIMSEATDGEPTVGAQITALQTTNAGLVGVSKVFDAKRVMLGTDSEKGLIEYAALMFRAGLFPPNPQSTLCDKKYCARWNTCIYHE